MMKDKVFTGICLAVTDKVLIAGAAGFIGFHLSQRLVRNGFNVVGIDN